jgi:predicted metalloprotease
MKWQGRQGSSNVEDRRGQSSGGGLSGLGGLAGGLLNGGGCGLKGGLGAVIVIVLVMLLGGGGNLSQLLNVFLGGDQSGLNTGTEYVSTEKEEEYKQFVSVVLKDTEDVWGEIFRKMGKTYRQPKLIIYNGYTSTSGCGAAQSAVGPFYCSADESIYVDLSFFDEMEKQFSAGGDFAYAYVIAHEVGHHVQKLLGTLEQVNNQRARSNEKQSNALSVRLELQADFYAGVWAYYTGKYNNLDAGDIDEALNAAEAIGDDRLQKNAQGYAVPDSFTHGTSQQRHDWFNKGYRTGDINQGDTFSGTI